MTADTTRKASQAEGDSESLPPLDQGPLPSCLAANRPEKTLAEENMTNDDLLDDYATPTIFACVARDRLLERIGRGEPQALADLDRLMPPDLPASYIKGRRDAEIRRMADALRAALPGVTRHGLAVLLHRAGRVVEQGRAMTSADAPDLDDVERHRLASEIGDLLLWVPATRRGKRWPSLRQIITIIGT